jgi:hypothetical protein
VTGEGSQAVPLSQPSVLLRVQGSSRFAYTVTTAALVTLASGGTALLVSQGTTALPGATALPPAAPLPDAGAAQGAVVVERPAGTLAAVRPVRPVPVVRGPGALLGTFARSAAPTQVTPAQVTSVVLRQLPAPQVAVVPAAPAVPLPAVPLPTVPVVPVATVAPVLLVSAPAAVLQRAHGGSAPAAERAAIPHHERHADQRELRATPRPVGHGTAHVKAAKPSKPTKPTKAAPASRPGKAAHPDR